MNQRSIPATFMRGGSSKGLFFNSRDLPPLQKERDQIFLDALGSPDIHGRQLNGMGGGLSSVSKAVVIKPSKRDDADIDYTFAQVSVNLPIVDFSATCGNLSSAVGPYAIDSGMFEATGLITVVKVFNTNLKQNFHAHIPTKKGKFEPNGDFSICGVSGMGSKICLDYIAPGGSVTGSLLPTGKVSETLQVAGEGSFRVSIVDAGTLTVFVDSKSFDLNNDEEITALENNSKIMGTLEKIRQTTSMKLGLSDSEKDCSLGTPKICLVGKPVDYISISGRNVQATEADISARYLSLFHKNHLYYYN